MQRYVSALCLSACLAPVPAGADGLPPLPSMEQLFSFCTAADLSAAQAQADILQWRRLPDADLDEWRKAHGASVGTVFAAGSWRRGPDDKAGALNWWRAEGDGPYQACAYSVPSDVPLLEELKAHLGPPRALDDYGDLVTAHWEKDGLEVYFSKAFSIAMVNISRRR